MVKAAKVKRQAAEVRLLKSGGGRAACAMLNSGAAETVRARINAGGTRGVYGAPAAMAKEHNNGNVSGRGGVRKAPARVTAMPCQPRSRQRARREAMNKRCSTLRHTGKIQRWNARTRRAAREKGCVAA